MPQRRLMLAIPLVAVALVGGLLFVTYSSQQEALSFRTTLVIEIVAFNNQTQNFQSYAIHPHADIGVPGVIMATTRYLGEGVGGLYPIHTRDASGNVFVDSRVVRSYTLGDFFDVWGEPLGRNNTLGYMANSTSVRVPYYWDMCVRSSAASVEIPNIEWGAHVLKAGEIIHLLYSQLGCA